MRQVILDTETTGLDPRQGHRIIEVAGLELVNRRPTGRHFHEYIHPDREIDADAQRVHGINLAFLSDKPRFAEIAPALIAFITDAELVIHNAPFDIGFLDAEFSRLGQSDQTKTQALCPSVIDTLKMAKELHPGKRNNLDALCERYAINNTQRTLHGALLDAELLAEVYLAMTRGQNSLIVEDESNLNQTVTLSKNADMPNSQRKPLRILSANEIEQAAHHTLLQGIDKASKGACLWLKKTTVTTDTTS